MTEKSIVLGNTGGNLLVTSELDKKLAALYKKQLPYGYKLSDDAALALATFTRSHDLDARVGEAYYLVRDKKDQNGNVIGTEEMGVFPGIKGKRKLANQQLKEIDPQAHYTRSFSKSDPAACGLQGKRDKISLVMRCELRDSISMGRYIVDITKLVTQAGYTKEEAEALLGNPPIWIGYGVVYNYELRYISMTPLALAKKRAESDATSQRFDLPFADDRIIDDLEPEIAAQLEGDKPVDAGVTVVTEKRSPDEILGELGYSSDSIPAEEPEEGVVEGEVLEPVRPYEPEYLKQQLDKFASKYQAFEPTKKQQSLLRHALTLLWAGDGRADEFRHDLLFYLLGSESTNDVSGQYWKAIIEDWLQVEKDKDTGEYLVTPLAIQEANKIVKAALKEEGQQELPL
jgi:hypothetical protein